jgi:hypothetical protein
MVFNATVFQVYGGGQFYWWMKREYPDKTINLQVTDKLFENNSIYTPTNILKLKKINA